MMPSIQISPDPNQSSLFAAIEQDLQGAMAKLKVAKPNQSSFASASGRCREESRDAEEGESSDRKVDIENPAQLYSR